ncbi:MAG: hypothetical protein A3Q59_00565 [Methanomethylophilus alvi]|nr:MAG: hypothetical protein A3Q59_00565 [Methanomethylophilus alvi]
MYKKIGFSECDIMDGFFDYVMQGSKGTKMPRGDKNQILNYQIIKTDTTSMNNIGFLDSLILNNIRTIEAINEYLIDNVRVETSISPDNNLGMI